jgi:hypothetical protein
MESPCSQENALYRGGAVFTVFLNSCVGARERPAFYGSARDASLFGAEFDVESHSFTHLAFNGTAWCRIPGRPPRRERPAVNPCLDAPVESGRHPIRRRATLKSAVDK